MALRTFRDFQQLRGSGFDHPALLLQVAEEKEARGEAWTVHYFRGGGRDIWTLVLPEEGRAVQWRDGEQVTGLWVADRAAVKLDERDLQGLYNLEGRLVPSDPWEDDEEPPDPIE